MLLTLAWRNIWRNKRRSVIILLSVAVGVVATILTDTLSRGMVFQILNNQIRSHVAHLQIHRAGFLNNPTVQSTVPAPERVDSLLRALRPQASTSRRVLSYGLLSSATSSAGVSFVGIEPEAESRVTTIGEFMVHGTYLSGDMNEVVIGKGLAEKLAVGVGDKVVGMASAADGAVGSDLFRIVGIFQTFSSEFDKTMAYLSLPNAQRMLGLGERISEIVVLLDDRRALEVLQSKLEGQLDSRYEVLSYAEILPLLVLQIDLYAEMIWIFYVIIGFALIFGIINSTLMSVFERIHEFGVLKAIGMKDGRLFGMVLLEVFTLGMVGTAAGFGAGYVLYLPLAAYGLDLSAFSESLTSFGIGAVIYPVLTWDVIANALFVIPLVAVCGAVYPAFRAVKLQPVEALRHV